MQFWQLWAIVYVTRSLTGCSPPYKMSEIQIHYHLVAAITLTYHSRYFYMSLLHNYTFQTLHPNCNSQHTWDVLAIKVPLSTNTRTLNDLWAAQWSNFHRVIIHPHGQWSSILYINQLEQMSFITNHFTICLHSLTNIDEPPSITLVSLHKIRHVNTPGTSNIKSQC